MPPPRKTEIKDEVTEIKIDTASLIPKEDCIVVLTNGRLCQKSFPKKLCCFH